MKSHEDDSPVIGKKMVFSSFLVGVCYLFISFFLVYFFIYLSVHLFVLFGMFSFFQRVNFPCSKWVWIFFVFLLKLSRFCGECKIA